jgi:hypothetical protein
MVTIDLIAWALSQNCNQCLNIPGIHAWLLLVRAQGCLEGEQILAAEKFDHFTELEGVACRGGVIEELALPFAGGVEVQEMRLER